MINTNVRYILIIIEWHVYIVVLNVLFDDVYMYKSLQIKFLFCSVLLISRENLQVIQDYCLLVLCRRCFSFVMHACVCFGNLQTI